MARQALPPGRKDFSVIAYRAVARARALSRSGRLLADTLPSLPEVVTASFVYYRLRKPDYSDDDRAAMAAKVDGLLSQNRNVFVFFKHEETPEGALHAEKLLRR